MSLENSKNVTLSTMTDDKKTENFILKDDLKGLTPKEKVQFYKDLCKYTGLDPITKPFGIYDFQGKEVLYIKADAYDQLAIRNKISLTTVQQDKETSSGQVMKSNFSVIGDEKDYANAHYLVKVKASRKVDGEVVEVEDFGMVKIYKEKTVYSNGSRKNAGWEIDSNAFKKAVTQASRRATKRLAGLSLMSEEDIEDIKSAKEINIDTGDLVGGDGNGDILNIALPKEWKGFTNLKQLMANKGDEAVEELRVQLEGSKKSTGLSEQWATVLQTIEKYQEANK